MDSIEKIFNRFAGHVGELFSGILPSRPVITPSQPAAPAEDEPPLVKIRAARPGNKPPQI